MNAPMYPSLYQINTRVWLRHMTRTPGKALPLDEIPDEELDRLADQGFEWIYFLSVWQTGEAGRRISRSDPQVLAEYGRLLPDLAEDDICGSGFAVTGYTISPDLGDQGALGRLRDRLHSRDLALMLDFIPNHTALDHPWVQTHPDFFIAGTEEQRVRNPHNFVRLNLPRGPAILAHGRDPYFDGWTDTLQLNYGNPALQDAMCGELHSIAQWCDGVRCDMAMLILPDVFEQTWGIAAEPFWPRAIREVRKDYPGFTFMAEVYWGLERTLQQQGFDYTYDKQLYDRLRELRARPVQEHFSVDLDFQQHSVRFLENHDEPRAASAFSPAVHRAAAVLTYLCPGLRFFHQGQLRGWRKRIPVQLCRGPEEPTDPFLQEFYHRLLDCLRREAFRRGRWQLLSCTPAWGGNPTWDGFIAFAWEDGDRRYLIAVNYASNQGQCYIPLPWTDLAGETIVLKDLMGQASYERSGDSLVSPGLYLDLQGWEFHVFQLRRVTEG